MPHVRDFIAITLVALTAAANAVTLGGCASPPQEKPATVDEIVQHNHALGEEMAESVEPQLRLRADPVVLKYLAQVARALVDSTPELTLYEPTVLMIRDVDGKYRSISLPGNRIYLSASALKLVQFDNEAAALMSIELGHLVRGHLFQNLDASEATETAPKAKGDQDGSSQTQGALKTKKLTRSPDEIDWLGAKGVLMFSEAQNAEALESAVGILYRAGYDPRGLVTVLGRYSVASQRAPYEKDAIPRLIEKTRRAISQYAPLRNPIVRTTEFVALQKRLRKL